MKVVYNNCFGGFGLSDAATHRYAEIKGLTLYPEPGAISALTTYWTVPPEKRVCILKSEAFHEAPLEARKASNAAYESMTLNGRDLARTDPVLVQVVEEMGEAANGMCASLAIHEVPAGERYRIDEYDGNESVMTVGDYEWQTAE